MDNHLLAEFRSFGEKDYSLTFNDSVFKADEQITKTYFKAILARDLFDGGNYFEETIKFDENLMKAKDLIKNQKLFGEMKIQVN